MDKDTYSSELKLRIDWSEMDLFGHVNNIMFMKYLQSARVVYWEKVGLAESFQTDKLGAMLVSAACQFKKPLFYPGNILIKSKVEFIKNTSFGLEHHIFNDENELVAVGNDVVVYYDYNLQQKTEIPDWLRKKISLL